jgi:hypothetical protein
MEAELDLCFHFLLVRYLWVMDESPAFSIWGLITSRCVFQAFDDSLRNCRVGCVYSRVGKAYCFTTSVMAHNNGHWTVKFNHGNGLVIKRPFRTDSLIYSRNKETESNLIPLIASLLIDDIAECSKASALTVRVRVRAKFVT